MFPLSIFPHRSYKVEGHKYRELHPLFLDEDNTRVLSPIIDLFQKALKEKWRQNEVEQRLKRFKKQLPGRKYPAIKRTLKDFFTFQEISLFDFVPERTTRELQKKGLTTLFELELYLYQVINEQYNGYLPLEKRDDFLKKKSLEFDFSSQKKLEEALSLALEKNYRIMLTSDELPTSAIITQQYHFHILETILMNSTRLVLEKKEKTGAFIKNAIYLCKKYLLDFNIYLYQESLQKSNKLIKIEETTEQFAAAKKVTLKIEGPKEVGGSPRDYSWHLKKFLLDLLGRYQEMETEIHLKIHQKKCFYKLGKKDLTIIKKSIGFLKKEGKVDIDSKIEAQFLRFFGTNSAGWKAKAESSAFIFQDTKEKQQIIIPDFELYRGPEELFFLEIIGYYRESYIQKKIEKLNALREITNQKMILLINSSIADRFSSLEDYYPIFIYDGKKPIPIEKIVRYLEQNVGSFKERLENCSNKNNLEKFDKLLEKTAQKKGILTNDDLLQFFTLYSLQELEEVFSHPEIRQIIRLHQFIYYSSIGLISKKMIDKIHKQISSTVQEGPCSITVIKKKISSEKQILDQLVNIITTFDDIEVTWETLIPLVRKK
ncbi:DUF790 family protein [Candidatus Heimdallarchaeota archaeon]|nr:MAG: DUF790 family protein [Candidatus Heimdallarchaeota archaeon]